MSGTAEIPGLRVGEGVKFTKDRTAFNAAEVGQ